jgi:hypothetical protein
MGKAGSESSGCPRLAHSPGSHRTSSGSLVVTHPFHPFNGQRLSILFERKRTEGLLYVCEGGPLGTIGLPAAWTSLSEPSAERPLTIEILSELAALVKALKSNRAMSRCVDEVVEEL